MTPAELRQARHALCLSAAGLAAALGVASGRTVRRWEAGERGIPGPVVRLITVWLASGHSPPPAIPRQ